MTVTATQIEIMIQQQEATLKTYRRREADYEEVLAGMEPGLERMNMRAEAEASSQKCKEVEYALEVLKNLLKVAR